MKGTSHPIRKTPKINEIGNGLKKDREQGLKPIRPVKKLFREVSGYRQYRLRERQQKYVSRHISKYARHILGKLKSRKFITADPVAVLTFLTEVNVTCDQEKIP